MEHKWFRIGGIINVTGKGMIGNPGDVQDIWARSEAEAQTTYARNNPSQRDPYSYPTLVHQDKNCPACDQLFCQYSWGRQLQES